LDDNVNLVIKLTNDCNQRCQYCYNYNDGRRQQNTYMEKGMIENLIKNALAYSKTSCTFCWHGGEPLLAGIDTFKYIIDIQKKYNTNNTIINNNMQTNGILLKRDIALFFNENNIGVSVSLDGPFDIQSSTRQTNKFNYNRIIENLNTMNELNIPFSVLTVVNKETLGHEQSLFDFYTYYNIQKVGLLPCIVANKNEVNRELTLTPDEYGSFLIKLFDIWCKSTNYNLSFRDFDEYFKFIQGKKPVYCVHSNKCGNVLVVDTDGKIYICDEFPFTEENCVGSADQPFELLDESLNLSHFRSMNHSIPIQCQTCEYQGFCNTGCLFKRWLRDSSFHERQLFCESDLLLFRHIDSVLSKLMFNKQPGAPPIAI